MTMNGSATARRLAATFVSVLAAGAALMAPGAIAAPGHAYSGQFGSPGGGAGQFAGPAGVAVEQSTGDVYVVDQFNNRVEKFDGTGGFLLAFGGGATPAGAFNGPAAVAVDQTSGHVYVADQYNNAVDVFDGNGVYLSQLDPAPTPAGAFSAPAGVAVDPGNGDVYVSDQFDNAVHVYTAVGAYVSTFDGSSAPDGASFATPTAIAVSGNHHVYVVDAGKAQVEEYTARGAAFVRMVGALSPQAVAVDPLSDEVYVGGTDANGQYLIEERDASGGLLFRFGGGGRVSASTGIGVKGSNDKVYVSDAGNGNVDVFAAFVAPDVTTDAATGVVADGASLNGTVGTGGADTSYSFNYGIDTNYGTTTPVVDLGTSGGPVTEAATGLSPNTTYHYQLVASNAQGSNAGDDATFTTAPAAPLVDGQPAAASDVTDTAATLTGTVNPNGSDTTYRFEYGPTTAYGSAAPSPDGDAGAAVGDATVSTTLTGLQPNTVYHFRVVADNGTGGPQAGADQTFTTHLAPPTATGSAPTGLTTTSATLQGTVDAHGVGGGTYRFVVAGAGVPYDGATASAPIPSGAGAVPVSAALSGLPAGGTFTARLDVVDPGGSASSELITFSLPAAPSVAFPAPPAISAAPYGCAHPHLDAYNQHPRGGDTIGITGSDLGVAATAMLGDDQVVPDHYTADGFDVTLPEDATGTLALTVNCGVVSNTIGIATYQPPSSAFTTSASIHGTVATISVKVPGAGIVRVRGTRLLSATVRARKAGTAEVKARLSASGQRALARAKSHRLTLKATIAFTPTGGKARSSTRTLVFRQAKR